MEGPGIDRFPSQGLFAWNQRRSLHHGLHGSREEGRREATPGVDQRSRQVGRIQAMLHITLVEF